MPYLIYLRKSRADLEAEAHGSGETLARHEEALKRLAHTQGLLVTAIYREIVSGDTIAARPWMQRLLKEVSAGLWEGVLVMEIERLARGDTKDQGAVAEAFRIGGTKIITPIKTYDPNNESDEEYFEFGLFMSRREYKAINRRIQRGRIASVQEGKYIASTAPYGYRRIHVQDGKGYTLKIIPEEADTVRLIFDLYITGELREDGARHRLGVQAIARRLDDLLIPPRKAKTWSPSTVREILSNPVYAGEVRWQNRKVVRQVSKGAIVETRVKNKDCLLAEGLHEPIVDKALLEKARGIMTSKSTPPVSGSKPLKNPFSGVCFCQNCGRPMTRAAGGRKKSRPHLKCPTPGCATVSAPLEDVEQAVTEALSFWLSSYLLPAVPLSHPSTESDSDTARGASSAHSLTAKKIEEKIRQIRQQQAAAYDFLEQGVYDVTIFKERLAELSRRMELLLNQQKRLSLFLAQRETGKGAGSEKEACSSKKSLPLSQLYKKLPDAEAKNTFLKTVLEKIEYSREKGADGRPARDPDFQLVLYPKLPHDKM